MVKDDQELLLPQTHQRETEDKMRIEKRGLRFKLAALGLITFVLSGMGFFMLQAHAPDADNGGGGSSSSDAKTSSHLFYDWPHDRKPDLAIMLSAQQYGFLKFCGCSEPQYGGLERRYNFMQDLKERGWSILPVDLGDIAQNTGPQALLKYRYSMEALNRLNYLAVGIGKNEVEMPLLDALAMYSLNNPTPQVLSGNLLQKDDKYPGMVASWAFNDPKGTEPRVGVLGVAAKSVAAEAQQKNPDVSFGRLADVMPTLFNELDKREEKDPALKSELLVLLFQGKLEEATAFAKVYPQFRIILCLTDEEEPSEKPEKVGGTLVIGVGHKGRYVGLVGIYRNGQAPSGMDLYYQLVQMAPEYETPPAKEAGHPILSLLEEYTREVKRDNYLARYPHLSRREPAFQGAAYVGSEQCKKCHEYAYEVWKNSPHSHAYDTLAKATKPSLRQYDGECVRCHVTGFGYKGGFVDEVKTPFLKDNGCENCHGPGSLHVGSQQMRGDKSKAMLAAMDPYKPSPEEAAQPGDAPEKTVQRLALKNQRLRHIDDSCQKCHDVDNDVHWDFEKKWPKIVHDGN